MADGMRVGRLGGAGRVAGPGEGVSGGAPMRCDPGPGLRARELHSDRLGTRAAGLQGQVARRRGGIGPLAWLAALAGWGARLCRAGWRGLAGVAAGGPGLAASLLAASAACAPWAAAAAGAAPAAGAGEGVIFNGQALDAAGRQTLRRIESVTGPVPPGRYWYDALTGAAGVWGGPVAVVLVPGLALGGRLAAEASGGGDGRLTGVFVNGRELHPFDVQRLRQIGPVWPGRYRWDAGGNVSTEAGVPLFNFHALVARSGRGNPYHRTDLQRGESTFVGKGCAAVHGRRSSGDSSTGYSYYVGC